MMVVHTIVVWCLSIGRSVGRVVDDCQCSWFAEAYYFVLFISPRLHQRIAVEVVVIVDRVHFFSRIVFCSAGVG